MADNIDIGSITSNVKIKIPRNIVKKLNETTKALADLQKQVAESGTSGINLNIGGGGGGGGGGGNYKQKHMMPDDLDMDKLLGNYKPLNPPREDVNRYRSHAKEIENFEKDQRKEEMRAFREKNRDERKILREDTKERIRKLKEAEKKVLDKDKVDKTPGGKFASALLRRMAAVVSISAIISFARKMFLGGEVATSLKDAFSQIADAGKDFLAMTQKDRVVGFLKEQVDILKILRADSKDPGGRVSFLASTKTLSELIDPSVMADFALMESIKTSMFNDERQRMLESQFGIFGKGASLFSNQKDLERMIPDTMALESLRSKYNLSAFGGSMFPSEMSVMPIQVQTTVREDIHSVDWARIGAQIGVGISGYYSGIIPKASPSQQMIGGVGVGGSYSSINRATSVANVSWAIGGGSGAEIKSNKQSTNVEGSGLTNPFGVR